MSRLWQIPTLAFPASLSPSSKKKLHVVSIILGPQKANSPAVLVAFFPRNKWQMDGEGCHLHGSSDTRSQVYLHAKGGEQKET